MPKDLNKKKPWQNVSHKYNIYVKKFLFTYVPDGVTGLRENRGLSSQGLQHLPYNG